MLYGDQLEKALLKNGLIDETHKKKRIRHKKFMCHKCGKPMIFIDNTNVMACECGQFFIFSN